MSGPFPILFIGVKEVGRTALACLLDAAAPVAAVLTTSGPGNRELTELARSNAIPVHEDPPLNDPAFHQSLRDRGVRAGVCFSFPRRIPESVLSLMDVGCYNFHPARLPEYRGCMPTVWPILNNDPTAHYTMHVMEASFDTGGIIDHLEVTVLPEDTGHSLYARMVAELPRLIRRHLPALYTTRLKGRPQDESRAGYNPAKLPNNGRIDWKDSAEQVERFVRALWHPVFKGALAEVAGTVVEILGARPVDETPPAHAGPGDFWIGRGRAFAACGRGVLEITAARRGDNTTKGNTVMDILGLGE